MNPSPIPLEVAARVWSAMHAFVTANDRNRELQEGLGLGRGTGRVRVLLLLANGPATLRDIAEANQIDRPYATVIVDKLVSLGLVERTAHPDDLRRKLVKLTEAGHEAVDHARRIFFEPPAGTRGARTGRTTPPRQSVDSPGRTAGGCAGWERQCLMAISESTSSPLRHFYGSDPSQFGDLHLPARQRRPGTVVLIHGGWWGHQYGADNLDEVAADIAGRGWVAWNIEYRRLGLGGGYPSTLEDTAAAIDYLATLEDVDTERVVAVGHSAGGHLAAWAAGRSKLATGAPGAGPVIEVGGVISLAGVVDLGAAAREKIGNGAAIELMGGSPDACPERYAIADPLLQVPIAATVRCVHARAGGRVPFAESVTYVDAATAAGQDAQLLEVDGSHFSIADISSSAWPAVAKALAELMGAD
jgi:acetyl esterase/lipase/DNA-binding HxlR family transcriptional regulator